MTMVREIEYTASPSVRRAVAALGQTEDVAFSPSNRRLAIAALLRNRITVFDIDIIPSPGGAHVALTGGVELSSPALQDPHGLAFIDDDTVIVMNRESGVALFKLPSGEKDVASYEVLPAGRPCSIGRAPSQSSAGTKTSARFSSATAPEIASPGICCSGTQAV
jgi:hypothetical protein